jgi:uncharacterized protein (TIGR02246 family)
MNTHRFVVAALAALFVTGVASTVHAQDSARGGKKLSVEARLQRMEDIEAIRELLVAYGRNFDKRDFAAYSQLFARDGVWTGGADGTQSFKGPDAIRQMVEKGFPPTMYPGSYHIMSSFDIDLQSENSASAWSRWAFVVHGVHGEPVIFRMGFYEDSLVREDGRWKFKSRKVAAEATR